MHDIPCKSRMPSKKHTTFRLGDYIRENCIALHLASNSNNITCDCAMQIGIKTKTTRKVQRKTAYMRKQALKNDKIGMNLQQIGKKEDSRWKNTTSHALSLVLCQNNATNAYRLTFFENSKHRSCRSKLGGYIFRLLSGLYIYIF